MIILKFGMYLSSMAVTAWDEAFIYVCDSNKILQKKVMF